MQIKMSIHGKIRLLLIADSGKTEVKFADPLYPRLATARNLRYFASGSGLSISKTSSVIG